MGEGEIRMIRRENRRETDNSGVSTTAKKQTKSLGRRIIICLFNKWQYGFFQYYSAFTLRMHFAIH